MRNTTILLLFLCFFSFVPTTAQVKLLTSSEAETLLKEAMEKKEKAAHDALRQDRKSAQENLRNARKEVGKYRIELFKARKRDFIHKQAYLSEEEACRFFPVYEELQDTLFHINEKVQRATKRLIHAKNKISDADYLAVLQQRIDADATKARLQAEYYKKFKELLSVKKLLLMYDADARFSHEMIRRHEGHKPHKK